MGILSRASGRLRHAVNLTRLAMATDQRGYSPAGWAYIASGGSWQALPYLNVINGELVAMMLARSRGVGTHLLVMAPPQHGKTTMIGHALPATWLGYFPDDNVILASYEAETAEKRGKQARDDFAEFAPATFGHHLDPDATAASNWGVAGHRGSMICRGVGGAITGAPCDLFINDDPIKDAKDVRSQLFRDDQWEWYMKVVQRRLRKHSCSVTIYTPWHEDDLGQRMIRASVAGLIPPLKVLRFPALAESQDERDEWAAEMGLPAGEPDPCGRRPGEALWPQVHTPESLRMWREADPAGFAALGQGRPRPAGGLMFRREWLKDKVVPGVPPGSTFCRFWDKAASDGKGDWTVGVLMAKDPDGVFYVANVVRERLSPNPRDVRIRDTAAADAEAHGTVAIRGDQDPAAAGKADAEAFVRLLAGYDVKTRPVSGDKTFNFRPFCSQAEGGNVRMVRGHWNEAWIRELEGFPGKFDDQVDATSGAFNHLAATYEPRWIVSPLDGYAGLQSGRRLRITG